MKLFLALLTNHKLDKLKRLVKSVQLQYHENTIQVEPIIVVNTLNNDYYEEVKEANFPFKVVRTESNGKPGRGKNSCYELFHQSDCDFISIIDGDDFLYPTFLRSLANHINHYPDLDVLCRIPLDCVLTYDPECGHRFCFTCIKDAIQKSGHECPMCRSRITSKRGLRKDKLIGKITGFIFDTGQQVTQRS